MLLEIVQSEMVGLLLKSQEIPPPLYSGLPMHIESLADPALDPLDVAAIQAPDGINSIGLPLLMDFKCFPTGSTTLGINTFDTSLPYVQGCPT